MPPLKFKSGYALAGTTVCAILITILTASVFVYVEDTCNLAAENANLRAKVADLEAQAGK